ncbi:MAG: IS6 family transposase, partial [Nitrososphaeria archaeon]
MLVEEVERNRISFEVKVLAVLLYFSGILLQELLAVRASFTRSSLDAEIFLNKVLGCCDNKPTFLVDKGPWYREAFERLGIEFRHET